MNSNSSRMSMGCSLVTLPHGSRDRRWRVRAPSFRFTAARFVNAARTTAHVRNRGMEPNEAQHFADPAATVLQANDVVILDDHTVRPFRFDRSKSKQTYCTPPELRHAVERRFGQIVFDLAASHGDEIVPLCRHFAPEDDSLAQEWPTHGAVGVYWLNPPFKKIDPWAKKCAEWREVAQPGSVIAFLVPLSADARWWRDHVRGKALVYALAPRVPFVGMDQGINKSIALCVYDPRHAPVSSSVELWRWR